jgi:hypothetical protein
MGSDATGEMDLDPLLVVYLPAILLVEPFDIAASAEANGNGLPLSEMRA